MQDVPARLCQVANFIDALAYRLQCCKFKGLLAGLQAGILAGEAKHIPGSYEPATIQYAGLQNMQNVQISEDTL